MTKEKFETLLNDEGKKAFEGLSLEVSSFIYAGQETHRLYLYQNQFAHDELKKLIQSKEVFHSGNFSHTIFNNETK